MERAGFWNLVCRQEIVSRVKSQEKEECVNFHPALFFVLDFLTLEAGIDKLSRNVIMNLLLYAA